MSDERSRRLKKQVDATMIALTSAGLHDDPNQRYRHAVEHAKRVIEQEDSAARTRALSRQAGQKTLRNMGKAHLAHSAEDAVDEPTLAPERAVKAVERIAAMAGQPAAAVASFLESEAGKIAMLMVGEDENEAPEAAQPAMGRLIDFRRTARRVRAGR